MTNLLNTSMESLLAESNGQKVLISCDDHGYFPGSKLSRPQMIGCKHCVMARLFYDFAKMDPKKREESAEMLERLTHHMIEDLERGTFDINIYDRPQISVETVDDDKPKIILTDSEF